MTLKLSEMVRQAKDLAPAVKAKVGSLESLFEEEPVPLTVFVQDKGFLANPPLSWDQYEAVRHAERVFYQELYPLMLAEWGDYWEYTRMVNLLTLEWGKGSGKDHICRIMSLRIAYMLLCLKSPLRYFGLPEQDTIHQLNVASSSNQAQQAYFIPLTKAVARKGSWFEDKCDPGQFKLKWDKNVETLSGHSDAESQEGMNLILGVADEIDAFRSKEEIERFRGKGQREPTKSAEGILDMMQTSAATRFPFTYKVVRISYPRFKGSTIQLLAQAAHKDVEERGDKSRHYVSGPKYTWVVNPRFKDMPTVPMKLPRHDGLVMIPETYEQDFLTTPELAMSKYMCEPSRAVSPYFRNDIAVESCMVPREPVKFEYVLVKARSGAMVWQPHYTFDRDFRPVVGAQYVLHADLALRQDRAGISMAHVASWDDVLALSEDEEGGRIERWEARPFVKVDFTISYEADLKSDPAREIQLRWARQLSFHLVELGFNIKLFTFDGWQSIDSTQILTSWGIESKLFSVDKSEEPWFNLRDLLYEGRASIPDIPLLRQELLSLTKVGVKVDHPPNGSKDLADSVAGACAGAVLLGGQEDPDGATAYPAADTFEVFQPWEHPMEMPMDLGPGGLGWSH